VLIDRLIESIECISVLKVANIIAVYTYKYKYSAMIMCEAVQEYSRDLKCFSLKYFLKYLISLIVFALHKIKKHVRMPNVRMSTLYVWHLIFNKIQSNYQFIQIHNRYKT